MYNPYLLDLNHLHHRELAEELNQDRAAAATRRARREQARRTRNRLRLPLGGQPACSPASQS